MSNAWQNYKNNLGTSRPWDVVNPNTEWVSNEVSKKRLDVCSACPELTKVTSQCKKCGCFMKTKAKIKHAACPLSKWDNE